MRTLVVACVLALALAATPSVAAQQEPGGPCDGTVCVLAVNGRCVAWA